MKKLTKSDEEQIRYHFWMMGAGKTPLAKLYKVKEAKILEIVHSVDYGN
jgi:hypothetical protein